MEERTFTIESNQKLARDVYRMTLSGDVSPIERPGQFVDLALPGLYLRRPISVCDLDREAGLLTLIYKVVGRGTGEMAALLPGSRLAALVGLGNGFDPARSGDEPLLVGGGVGVPPLYWLAKTLLAQGKRVQVLLGFREAADVFYEDEFRALGAAVTLVTEDGSRGERGRVTDVFPAGYSHLYACGPEPMLRAVWQRCESDGQFSFEQRMGCGFGACLGCTCRTKTGEKHLCKEGPVLMKEEIQW